MYIYIKLLACLPFSQMWQSRFGFFFSFMLLLGSMTHTEIQEI